MMVEDESGSTATGSNNQEGSDRTLASKARSDCAIPFATFPATVTARRYDNFLPATNPARLLAMSQRAVLNAAADVPYPAPL